MQTIIKSGYHKERKTQAHIMRVHNISPDDNKDRFMGFEIVEYSPQAKKFIGAWFHASLKLTLTEFQKFYNEAA